MVQLFFQPAKITDADWAVAYAQIVALATAFPLQLMRIEAYNGYEKGLDKKHFELRENIGSAAESLSFYGDWVSYTSGRQVTFYKDWQKQVEKELVGEIANATKPITWYPPQRFKDDGSFPTANGLALCNNYINTNEAPYEYALIAIGVLLEKLLPNAVFMTAPDEHIGTVLKIVEWLEGHFKTTFELPLYFDKPRLLASFIGHYADKKDAVGRLENIYRKQFKRNLDFAIEHIGYEPTFDCYAEILTLYSFGTFGFSDVLTPWIATTKDVESILNLIAESKLYLIEQAKADPTATWLDRELAAYDLTDLLKKWLNEFILWTPQQREQLTLFYTNQQALETGKADLMDSLMRMGGYRINICPIHATYDELFEAFMYHDPKNGAVFKQIIDDWLAENATRYSDLVAALDQLTISETVAEELAESVEISSKKASVQAAYLAQYPQAAQFIIKRALKANPIFLRIETAITELYGQFQAFIQAEANQSSIEVWKAETKAAQVQFIRYRLKKLRLCIHPEFENWLVAENDPSVLFHLRLLMGMKFTDRPFVYTCFRVLWDRRYWEIWRTGTEYAI